VECGVLVGVHTHAGTRLFLGLHRRDRLLDTRNDHLGCLATAIAGGELLLNHPTHVVTLGIDYADGLQPGRVIHELCRGDPNECMALMYRVSTPSDDRRPIEHWWMQFGPIPDWENFANSM
jgi:hypothetical protein